MSENLSLFLARRQKRLHYWRELFNKQNLDEKSAARFSALFEKYKMLIAKAVKAPDEASRQDACEELKTLDRDMTRLFEERRLMTSDLGVGAVVDYSHRGSGGSLIRKN